MQLFAPHAKDFYKAGHREQYTIGTNLVYSNFTARSGKWSNIPNNKGIITVGLQYFILDYLIKDWNETFFNKPKNEVIKKYKRRISNALGYNFSIKHMADLHDLGYLPIKIKALPEGSFVPYGVPTCTISSTNDNFYWVTNMIESVMSAESWMITTSATTYNAYRKMFEKYAILTGGDLEFVPFQGHDFSFRGMPGRIAAAMSGFGALAAGSCGTDTIPAIDFAEEFYGADSDIEMVAMSANATEHAVMCSGSMAGEFNTYQYLINELYPIGLLSIVSDTWDLTVVIKDFLASLKNDILTRDGKVVIRPDSGDPVQILCGYDNWDDIPKNVTYPEILKKGIIQSLWDIFGGTFVKGQNGKEYKLLNSHIGALYGDSILYRTAQEILKRLELMGFASTNVVLGVGSYTYQGVTRDTHGTAMKATYVEINGKGREIFKDPATDDGTKKSAKGLLRIDKVNGKYVLKDQCTKEQEAGGELKLVFENGKLIKRTTLDEIRKIVRSFD